MARNGRDKACIGQRSHVLVFFGKKGFTLLEILIVMIVISILLVSLRTSFQIKDKDILYGQACIENIYGQVSNFIHAGLSSKSLYTASSGKVFPDQYIFNFSKTGQKITLSYKIGNTGRLYTTISLSGDSTIAYCSSNNYRIFLSGEDYTGYINKGLQENGNMQVFYLSNAKFNGETRFIQCDKDGMGCRYIGRFESDTRTISLKKQICLDFPDTGNALDCIEWDN